MELNKNQSTAVTTTASYVAVIAHAGSGKTRVLTGRVLHLAKLCPTDKILAVTFSRAAKNEMIQRIGNHQNIEITNFHSWCYRFLKKRIKFTILDGYNQRKAIKPLMPVGCTLKISDVIRQIGLLKLYRQIPDDAILADIYTRYMEFCYKYSYLDFTDLLLKTSEILASTNHNYYQHVLVDEFQDTDPIQYEILKLLKPATIFVVGDPKQGIYSFRGANPENIELFIREYNATIIDLQYNYRSCKKIIKLANTLFDDGHPMLPIINRDGLVSKIRYRDNRQEAMEIAKTIKNLWIQGNRSIAILCRKRASLPELELAIQAAGIPTNVVGARPFLEHVDVQYMLAWLRYATNENDVIALKTLLLAQQGIGTVTAENIMIGKVTSKNHDKWVKFVTLANRIVSDCHKKPLSEAISNIIKLDKSIKDGNRLEMLRQFAVDTSLDDFIEMMSTEPEENQGDAVQILTIHKSKGAEFNCVFLPGAEEGYLPMNDTAEETRIVYVAITRAKDVLYVSCAQTRRIFGNEENNEVSRFFK